MGESKVRNKARAIALSNQRSPQIQQNYHHLTLAINHCTERLYSVRLWSKLQVCI
ncbi:hypothetical protein [Nostoc sp.]